MPTITVSGIIADGDRVLLVRRGGSAQWLLPGGVLTDADETVEDALARSLSGDLGIEVTGQEFLDTAYERGGSEVVVHNLFAVTSIAGGMPQSGERGTVVLTWAGSEELADMPLPGWLAETLPALLAGEPAPAEGVDLVALSGSLRAALDGGAGGGPALERGTVLIVTGPAGAGKSTVARAWCERFPRAAHIDVDLLRWRMVASGYVPPEASGADAAEARRQLALAVRNAAALARNFLGAGFRVVIDDVLERAEDLDVYLDALAGMNVALVTLLPDAATLRARDQGRAPEDRMGQRSEELWRIIAANGERRGLRLDSSAWSVEQTVDAIIERMDEATVAVAWAGA